MRFADHPTALSDPSTGLVAIAWNGWSQWFGMVVAINRNAWSRSIGGGGRNHSVRAGDEVDRQWSIENRLRSSGPP